MTEPAGGQLLNREELQQYILRRLGAPLWEVYLTQEHLDDAVDQAIRWFTAKKGVFASTFISVSAAVTEYTLPDDVDKVLDVAFPVAETDASLIFSPNIFPDDRIPYDVFSSASSGGMYSAYTQALQYIETAKRVTGAELEWRQDNRTLYIFPAPESSGSMWIEYKSTTVALDQLDERDHDLVKRYALAFAKKDLGTILARVDQYPVAQGPVQFDGQRLIDEADREMEKLDEELTGSGFPMMFVTG